MNRKSFQASENDFGIFLLTKAYKLGLSARERQIFIDRFFRAFPMQRIVNSNDCSLDLIQNLFARIYQDIQANNYYFCKSNKICETPDVSIANVLLMEFLDLHSSRLSRSENHDSFYTCASYKGIKQLQLIDSFLANNIYDKFFKRVNSLYQFILASESLKQEFNLVAGKVGQGKSSMSLVVYMHYIGELCNALPKIVELLAKVSNFSESDICLNLLKKLEPVEPTVDERVQDRLERLYQQSAVVERSTVQSPAAIYRYTDKLLYPHPKSLYKDDESLSSNIANMSWNLEDTISQNQVNHNRVSHFQDVMNDLSTRMEYLNTLAAPLERLYDKQRLTLSSVLAKYPDVSARFPFHELDLYAVYCFVKRNLITFNLTDLIRLESAIAQGYLYCMSQIQGGINLDDIDPTNYLKQNCYAAILDFYEGYKLEISEHPKIQKFKSLNQAHKDRFGNIWNQRIESLLKNIWVEIEHELPPYMSSEKLSFADTGQIAKEYCQRLFTEFGQLSNELLKILEKSMQDKFIGIWIDECDIFLAKELSLIDEDDTFIYGALVTNLNKYIVEKFDSKLSIYSLHQNITDGQRIKIKLESLIQKCQKKYQEIKDREIQNTGGLIALIKDNKYLRFRGKATVSILQFALSTILSSGIAAWINFTFLNPNVPNFSIKQLDSIQETKPQQKTSSHPFENKFQGMASWYYSKDNKQETANNEPFGTKLMTLNLPRHLKP